MGIHCISVEENTVFAAVFVSCNKLFSNILQYPGNKKAGKARLYCQII